jgi:hypothetical protein
MLHTTQTGGDENEVTAPGPGYHQEADAIRRREEAAHAAASTERAAALVRGGRNVMFRCHFLSL